MHNVCFGIFHGYFIGRVFHDSNVWVTENMLVLLSLNFLASLLLIFFDPFVSKRKSIIKMTVILIIVITFASKMPPNIFERLTQKSLPLEEKIIYHKEEISANITVTETNKSNRLLRVNGHYFACLDISCSYMQRALAYLPVLLHPAPQNAAIIGYGSGESTYMMSLFPEIEYIDIAEISTGVINASFLFQAINHNIISNSNVKLTIDDGRHFLLASNKRYDVLSVDAPRLTSAGTGALYTKEFTEDAICA